MNNYPDRDNKGDENPYLHQRGVADLHRLGKWESRRNPKLQRYLVTARYAWALVWAETEKEALEKLPDAITARLA